MAPACVLCVPCCLVRRNKWRRPLPLLMSSSALKSGCIRKSCSQSTTVPYCVTGELPVPAHTPHTGDVTEYQFVTHRHPFLTLLGCLALLLGTNTLPFTSNTPPLPTSLPHTSLHIYLTSTLLPPLPSVHGTLPAASTRSVSCPKSLSPTMPTSGWTCGSCLQPSTALPRPTLKGCWTTWARGSWGGSTVAVMMQ